MTGFLALGLLSLVVHEAGHAAAALCFHGRPRLVVRWAGPGIAWQGRDRHGAVRATVALAGPAASLALAAGLFTIGQAEGALISLALGLSNLCPFRSSDGRHAWEALR